MSNTNRPVGLVPLKSADNTKRMDLDSYRFSIFPVNQIKRMVLTSD